jgi:hypothetical protein
VDEHIEVLRVPFGELEVKPCARKKGQLGVMVVVVRLEVWVWL